MKLKPRDRVKVIDDVMVKNMIQQNKIYTVQEVDEDGDILLKEVKYIYFFSKSRFKKVKTLNELINGGKMK